MLFTSILFCCFLSLTEAAASDAWKNQDPSSWKTDYPKCGSGTRQSPLNLVTSKMTCNKSLSSSLTFPSYVSSGNFTVENNDYLMVVHTTSSEPTASFQSATYKLVLFHFHWGSSNDKGSEHQVNGHKYPAELHYVYYNSNYSTFDNAANKSDGILVFGVLINVGKENAVFKKFLDLNVTASGTKVDFKAFNVITMLPKDKKSFYQYPGSFTAPPCYESAAWIVFKDPIEISQAQLDKFRALKKKTGADMENNYRPIQNRNDRPIYASFEDCTGSAGSFTPSIIVLVVAFFCFAF